MTDSTEVPPGMKSSPSPTELLHHEVRMDLETLSCVLSKVKRKHPGFRASPRDEESVPECLKMQPNSP
jgi:hypothetical protein